MTGSATQGIKTVLHSVSGGPRGMTPPMAYCHMPDIEDKPAEVAAAGATVTDPDGDVLGLLQDR